VAKIKKIGITGGKGFIGSALKEHFLKKKIKLIDYNCNLSNFDEALEAFQKQGASDLIIHLAGRFSQDINIALKDNLTSTLNLLDLISMFGTKNIIFASTGAIYGNSGIKPIDENHIEQPNTEYGLIKHWCEQAILFHAREKGTKSTILRLPSVYGKNNNKGIIYEWLKATKDRNEIFINGNGSQHRSFINAEDIAEGIERIINKDVDGIYNFSHPNNYSLNDLALIFKTKFNCKICYKKKDSNNNLESMVLESAKLYEAINWQPSKDINSYIESIST